MARHPRYELMVGVSKPHASVADKLPAGVGTGVAVRDRSHTAGATAGATAPVVRARTRLLVGRADVHVRASGSDRSLRSVTAVHGVPSLIVVVEEAVDEAVADVVLAADTERVTADGERDVT